MRWREAHQEAMIAAADAHLDGELETFGRIDVFAAMHAAGLKLMFKPLTGSAALYLPPAFGARPGAIINANHPLAMQRFSAAHEYGHHVLGHRAPQVVHEPEPRFATDDLRPEEKLAEAFASWFLMPPEAVELALERLEINELREPQQAYAAALRLGVSYTAMCVHLPSLKLLARQTARAWAGRSLKSIKQELSTTPPPGGWRADVWRLVDADVQAPLVVRAGDRLLLPAGPPCERFDVPPDAELRMEPPADLLSSTAQAVVDLAVDTPAGPAQLALTAGERELRFDLIVERPRRGLYMPTVAMTR